MAWHTPNPDLLQQALASERAPFKIPAHAVNDRWTELLKVLSVEYVEVTEDNGDLRAKITVQVRVADNSTDRTNVGKVLKMQKTINWTQFETRTKNGQAVMSDISIRQLGSLLLAARIVATREEINPQLGIYFDPGNPIAQGLLGVTVIGQIEQTIDNRGEPQQEATRFAPVG